MGYLGMPRRYHVYPPEFQVYHVLSTSGAAVLGVAYLLPLVYLLGSLFLGKAASANPWDAKGLEWQTASPPPHKNFVAPPNVPLVPYDYHPKTGPHASPEAGARSQ
jgi:cytochrome c oxidase subunit 1